MNAPKARKLSYYHEISMMMYGFGDSHKPRHDTVLLVESIVLQQLRTIINEAMKYWNGDTLTGQDLVFLLRRNKYKMQRFVKHLINKDLSKKVRATNPSVVEIDAEPVPRHKLIDFIEKIDETGEFMDTSEVDEVKLERMIRADQTAQSLNEKKYLEFQRARCASFKGVSSRMDNIRHWIDPKKEMKFSEDALEVLSYFAFQTVAELIDYALLVREDVRSGADPVKHLPGSYYTATMFQDPLKFGMRPDYTRVRSGQQPITVSEIEEVMRRIYSPQTGKLNFGGKVPDMHYMLAL